MADLSSLNPTNRFTGLAETYARHRPRYPGASIDFVIAHCALGSGSLLVDVGCGTGISSRLFAARGIRVIGIDPNAEMRAAAESAQSLDSHLNVTYHEGRAESTGLPFACADAVLAAQAFHWFEPVATLQEFHRILRTDGWVVLMWNERDERDSFTAAYGDVFRSAGDAAAIESARQAGAGQALFNSPLFQQAEAVSFPNEQAVDEEGMLGRAFSASYAPKEARERAEWADRFRAVFREHQRDRKVVLHYRTSVFLARRADTPDDE
jgi:SAM-dependent methyltransferase